MRFVSPIPALVVFGLPTSVAYAQVPLDLEIESPNANGPDIPLQYASGWSLSFKITPVNDNFTFANVHTRAYPELGATSFLVLKDNDGCPRLTGNVCFENPCPVCPDIVGDEQFLEFTPDTDYPGIVDAQGRADLRTALKNERVGFTYGPGPMAVPVPPAITSTVGLVYYPVGPGLSGTVGNTPAVDDGIGYGANDDLPGLVVVSNVGVGRVLDMNVGFMGQVTGFNDTTPLAARNLAGLMTSVTAELRAQSDETVIRTRLEVPRHLFVPLVIIDECHVGPVEAPFPLDGYCSGGTGGRAYRIDGGPIIPVTNTHSGMPHESQVALTAFIVQGTAPTIITDCSGDDSIGADDAECMGYELLSNEVYLEFRQIGNEMTCGGGSVIDPWGVVVRPKYRNMLAVDFEGNGTADWDVCPSGNGTITHPPRQTGN